VNVPGVEVSERPSASLPSHNFNLWGPVRKVLGKVVLKTWNVVPPNGTCFRGPAESHMVMAI